MKEDYTEAGINWLARRGGEQSRLGGEVTLLLPESFEVPRSDEG